jgi:hypothetical protein
MNYIVEDNFDFYSELNQPVPVEKIKQEDSSRCMISHEILTYNSITLSCTHSFNYVPLYNELCLYNNKEYINCPYCRCKANKLLPFIPLPGIKKIYGVNYPPKMSMPLPKCSFIRKTGVHKGLPCLHMGIEYEDGVFCDKHMKYTINSVWTPEKEQLLKSKSVPELKAMLKAKGLKIGGLKKELVNRLFSAN